MGLFSIGGPFLFFFVARIKPYFDGRTRSSPLPKLDGASVLVLPLDCRLVSVFNFRRCSLRVMTYTAFVLHPRFPPKRYSLFASEDIVYSHCTRVASYSATTARTADADEKICIRHGRQEGCCTVVAVNRL